MARAHGVSGEVAVDVLTSVPDVRFASGSVLAEVDGARRFTVTSVRPHQARLLVRFAEVASRAEAQSIQGLLLEAADEARPPDGEMWADDLEGYSVVVHGDRVGVVREVLENPAHDLLVVARPDGSDALIPLVLDFVKSIEPADRVILVDLPEGLL